MYQQNGQEYIPEQLISECKHTRTKTLRKIISTFLMTPKYKKQKRSNKMFCVMDMNVSREHFQRFNSKNWTINYEM